MEDRKRREQHFHNHFRGDLQPTGDPKFSTYRKWYAAGYRGEQWLYNWLRDRAVGKRVLDYACGSGDLSIKLAQFGAEVVAFDISDRSIELAREKAAAAGLVVDFHVLDAENTGLAAASFDIVVCSGVLHHMDLNYAYPEIARILKPNGTVIALECLGHNPLINWYRKRTPYLRSPDEHPLMIEELQLARQYFDSVQLRFFNLATLAAAPLWKTTFCKPAANVLGLFDAVLLKVPVVQRQAWMVGALLQSPRNAEPVLSGPLTAGAGVHRGI